MARKKVKNIKSFGRYIRRSLKRYFSDLKGTEPTELYQQMVEELERHLFEYVMSHTNGNITRTANILGISRSTLRKKLDYYGIPRER